MMTLKNYLKLCFFACCCWLMLNLNHPAHAAKVASLTTSNGSGTAYSLSTGGSGGELGFCTYTPASNSTTQYNATCNYNVAPLDTSGNAVSETSASAIAAIPGMSLSNSYFAIGTSDGGIYLCAVGTPANPLNCGSSTNYLETFGSGVSNLIYDSVSQVLWATTDTGSLLYCPFDTSLQTLKPCTTAVSMEKGSLPSTLTSVVQSQPQSQPLDIYYALGQGGSSSVGGDVLRCNVQNISTNSPDVCTSVVTPTSGNNAGVGSSNPYQVLAGQFMPQDQNSPIPVLYVTTTVIANDSSDNSNITYACPISQLPQVGSSSSPISIEDCPYKLNSALNLSNAIYALPQAAGNSSGAVLIPNGSSVNIIKASAEMGTMGGTALQNLNDSVNSVVVDQNGNVFAQYGGYGLMGANPFADGQNNQYSLIAESGSSASGVGSFLEQLFFCLLGVGLGAA